MATTTVSTFVNTLMNVTSKDDLAHAVAGAVLLDAPFDTMNTANKDNNNDVPMYLSINDIVIILQKLSPNNDQENRVAEKLKSYLTIKLFWLGLK